MDKQFVPYELALKLKELDFNDSCIFVYLDRNTYRQNCGLINHPKQIYPNRILAPLWQQVFDWFDENSSYQGFIIPSIKIGRFDWEIRNSDDENFILECDEYYSSRMEAKEACLKKLIELESKK